MEEVSLRTPQDASALPPGQLCVRAEDEAGIVGLCEEQVRQAAQLIECAVPPVPLRSPPLAGIEEFIPKADERAWEARVNVRRYSGEEPEHPADRIFGRRPRQSRSPPVSEHPVAQHLL